jgi:hypothetical protein
MDPSPYVICMKKVTASMYYKKNKLKHKENVSITLRDMYEESDC